MYSTESSGDFPTVGDWAFVQYYNSDTLAIILDLFPRKSFLKRKAAGKKIEYQMIASNIDVAFIVQSCDFDFNLRRMERYLVTEIAPIRAPSPVAGEILPGGGAIIGETLNDVLDPNNWTETRFVTTREP